MSDFSQIAKLPTLNKKQNHKVVHPENREILHNYQTLVVSAIIAPTTKNLRCPGAIKDQQQLINC